MSSEMRTVGMGFYWQDLKVGDRYKSIGRTITETDLMNFVTLTGMTEVLFTNREFLEKTSVIKGRVVPGVLVYAYSEGLLIPTMQGTGLAFLEAEFKVKGPTFVGDTIHVEVEVLEVRPTSKGNRAIVRTMNTVVKQTGETVITYNPLRMLKGRD